MSIIDAVVSFICALSASMGVGSGGLLIVYLSLARSVSQKDAQGINLIFFVITMSLSLVFHKFKKRVETHDILYVLLPALPACILGSFAAKGVNQDTLKTLFGVFLILCGTKGISTILNKTKKGL
jgi:uncharacterized membrane protein YfcA